MKKTTKIISIIIALILLIGIIFTTVNNFMNKDMKISSKLMEELSKSNKIIIKDKNQVMGTITEESVIEEILSIMSEATINMSGSFTCEGTTLYFEMYNDNKLIDKVDVYLRGNINPKSIAKGGCSKYNLPSKNKTDLNIIIEEQTGTKFFNIYDYSEACDQALELIYEDEEYRYYFSCIKSDQVFIEFITTNLKITVKKALEGNYISISELTQTHPDLFYKEKK